ncbi:MAG: sigma-70 family RNA polymerase sigma factor [Oscillospiraceae bacterium]
MFFLFMTISNDDRFDLLYEQYHRAMYRLALSVLRQPQLAEDAVQNAFLRVFQNLDKIEAIDCSKTRAYLIVIVRRESFKLYNQGQRDMANLVDVDDAPILETLVAHSPEMLFDHLDEVHRLRGILSTLSETDQYLLIGKYAYGYQYRDLALLLGMSEKNVSVRITRARQRLVAQFSTKEGSDNA